MQLENTTLGAGLHWLQDEKPLHSVINFFCSRFCLFCASPEQPTLLVLGHNQGAKKEKNMKR